MLTILVLGAVLWVAIALVAGVVLGRAVRLADHRAAATGCDGIFTPVQLGVTFSR